MVTVYTRYSIILLTFILNKHFHEEKIAILFNTYEQQNTYSKLLQGRTPKTLRLLKAITSICDISSILYMYL